MTPTSSEMPKIQFIRLPTVLELTGLSRASIYRLIKENKFPRQVTLNGGRAVAWQLSAIHDWQMHCVASSRQ